MSDSSYFACVAIKVKDDNAQVLRYVFHDTVVSGPWAIRSDSQLNELKETIAKKLNVEVNDMIITNLSLLYQSL